MKTTTRTVAIETFASEIHPEITTEDPREGEILAWADANPQAWKIVTTSKSRAFGLGSSVYLGCFQTSKTPAAVIDRLATLRRFVLGDPSYTAREQGGEDNIFAWRARFTLKHFSDKGFKGGLFTQHSVWSDGETYRRSSLDLDFTPEILDEVMTRFLAWASHLWCETDHVTIDGVRHDRSAKEEATG